jgi:arabinose-5-phosphate isomerase
MTALPSVSRPVSGIVDSVPFAQGILRHEAEAILTLAARLDGEFSRCAKQLLCCSGHVVVTGIGKAGLIGQKISATLASTGTPSYFLHPSEALHGDLGRIRANDVVLALSHSGETEELIRLSLHLRTRGIPLMAMTSRPRSRLGCRAHLVLELGEIQEADPLGLAPSTSTTAMLALGDALALAVANQRGFSREEFARYHPGGSLGLELAKVEDVMRPLKECRIASARDTIRAILIQSGRPGRRTGAVMLIDDDGRLAGIFTDSDLARLLEQRRDANLDMEILHVMTRSPASIQAGRPFREALELLRCRKISELPVVEEQHHPLGLIDVTDVLSLLPAGVDAADTLMNTDTSHDTTPVTLPIRRTLSSRGDSL